MVTIAVLRATGFSQIPDEEYIFYIIQRGFADLILLEEKNTDKRYRIEYDDQYRQIEQVVKEIVEELRTREFDNHLLTIGEDLPMHWHYYTRVVHEICDLIDHGVDAFELQGNTSKVKPHTSAEPRTSSQTVVISLSAEIEAEFQFVKSKFGLTDR